MAFPHITPPTRFSNNNGTLIYNIFCILTDSTIKTTSGILTKQSIIGPSVVFTFQNTIPHKEPSPTHIKIDIQTKNALYKFIYDIVSSTVCNLIGLAGNLEENTEINLVDWIFV